MDSVDSLWNIMDLKPEEQVEVSDGRCEFFTLVQPTCSDTVTSDVDFEVEEIVLKEFQEPSSRVAGVKRRSDESLNSSLIDESKLVIVSDDESFRRDSLQTNSLPQVRSFHPPSLEDLPGPHNFSVRFPQLSDHRNRHWAFSQLLKKLYIDMDHWLHVQFLAPPGLYIRALPVFSQPTDISKPVVRCPHHASPADRTNQNFNFPRHLVRVAGVDSVYHEDSDTGRLSVIFPVEAPAPGAELVNKQVKFMCLGSDMGGICRRSVKLVFTLEDGAGAVLGRQVFGLRLCSCPKR